MAVNRYLNNGLRADCAEQECRCNCHGPDPPSRVGLALRNYGDIHDQAIGIRSQR